MLVALAYAGEVRYDCAHFVEAGLNNDPVLAETRYGTDAKRTRSAL